MIEWKYTESYPKGQSKYIPARARIYDPIIQHPDCPIQANPTESLFYEPYYQLMRQNLLGWLMVQAGEYGCSDYLHIHVIPESNHELRNRVTSPGLSGDGMSQAWKSVLNTPECYFVITPEDFLEPIWRSDKYQSIINYLSARYDG
jgi:hypothetical protein